MPSLTEFVARLRGEPYTDREKSLAFVNMVRQIYNHEKIITLQGEANNCEKWFELTDIKWKRFERLLWPFGLGHLISLKVGCQASEATPSGVLKLQFEFRETPEEVINLPIPARVNVGLGVDDNGRHSGYVKIWYFRVKSPNPDHEVQWGRGELPLFISLGKFVKEALDGKFGGKILPGDLGQSTNQ